MPPFFLGMRSSFQDPALVFATDRSLSFPPVFFLYLPNDILSKKLFNLTDEDYIKAIKERDTDDVLEKKNHRQFGDIIAPFFIRVDDKTNFTLTETLDQFDLAVLCACISEWRANNHHTPHHLSRHYR